MSAILNATDPGHLDSDTEPHSPGSNAVTRAQAAAQNTTSQSEPTIPPSQPSPQVPGPSSTTAGESEDIDMTSTAS